MTILELDLTPAVLEWAKITHPLDFVPKITLIVIVNL
jgi:hypothetical protein